MEAAVITGGAQGIGKAIAMKLMAQGIFVFVIDMDQEAIDDFLQEHGNKESCHVMRCDVGDAEALKGTLDEVLLKNNHIRYLVNNAALMVSKPLQELDLKTWNEVLAVNLTSYFLTVKYLAEALKASGGAVVNLCSTRAFMSEPDTESYSASKGGVFALTHSLAISLQPFVRVNCVSPGWIDVTSWKKKSQRQDIDWEQKHHKQHPAGRIGIPEDIASLAWFLLSDKAGFITGQNFIADGGMSRKMIYE